MLTLIIIIALNISCNQEKVQNQNSQKNLEILKTISDTSKFTVIEYNEDAKWVFSENCKKTNLTKNDLDNIDFLLNEKVQKDNFLAEKIDLDKYKRQYVTVINEKNEKIVWINCFCGNWTKNSRKQIFAVEDGGNCYFNLKINLTTKKIYDFIVNGEA